MFENVAATAKYATAPIAVWWDMNDCPIPEGYDATCVRPSLEEAFKNLGYTGPVSITGYADLEETPDDLLRELISTGITVAHSAPEHICSFMYSDILEWRAHNPPPATMMLIADRVEHVLSWDLARLQQQTYYNLFRAYSVRSVITSDLQSSAEWLWDSLLVVSPDNETPSAALFSAMFYCKLCSWNCQTLKTLRKHLSSTKHVVKEARHSGDRELDPVTHMWGMNYKAKSEYAQANIGVWWNMEDCPIPEGYDACHVRPSLEGALRSLGYNGSVSIIAFANQNLTPDHVLQGLSSTGVDVAHTIPDRTTGRMSNDMRRWRDHNPPPATMMLISNRVEQAFAHGLVRLQQPPKYNICLAYKYRPGKLSALVTRAEWLWDSLFAVSETRAQLVQKKCSGQSTGMFYCKLCYCDYNGLGDFRKHLASDGHLRTERRILSDIRYRKHQQELGKEMQSFKESISLGRISPGLRKLMRKDLKELNRT